MYLIKSKVILCFKVVIYIGLITAQGCQKNHEKKVDTSSKSYHQAVSAFYQGIAATQTDHLNYAANQMLKLTKLYPREAAAWANLGVMALRQGNFSLAQKRLKKAKEQSPKNSDIIFLQGLAKNRQGKMNQALPFLRKAQKMDPDNPKILFSLVQALERVGSKNDDEQIKKLLGKLADTYPENRFILIELVRVAAKNGDHKEANRAINKLKKLLENASSQLQTRLQRVTKASESGDSHNLAIALTFLENELQKTGSFQHEVAMIQLPKNQIGFLITYFLSLPRPTAQIAVADKKISFTSKPVAQKGRETWIKAMSLQGQLSPDFIQANQKKVTINDHKILDFPGGDQTTGPNFHSITMMDYNYDFRNDLIFAGPGGFRLYRQNADTTFTDVTDQTKVPKKIVEKSYSGAWTADFDSDGDLDIILSQTKGAPVVLQNNGDNTFKRLKIFNKVRQLKDFAWADLDEDGDADGVFLSRNGELTIYLNNRLNDYSALQSSKLPTRIKAMNVNDLNRDGMLDIVTVNNKGNIQRFWYDDEKDAWNIADIAKTKFDKTERLFVNDLDNNGGMDLLLSALSRSQIWLSKPDQKYEKLQSKLPVFVSSVADVSGDKRLDLMGWSKNQQNVVKLINQGTKNYHAQIIRPRASGPTRERRINSFGIGSEIESRSGLMYQKKRVTSPVVHVGLGTYKKAEMIRIIWPNGLVQADFAELGNGSIITNKQMLKGSCPWLFTYNGRKMKFQTNVIWNAGLGIRINAQRTGGVVQTRDRIKINGHQLKPRNGYYDLRITGELWETYYFDKIGLMAVDHPDSTAIFVNEKYSIPPPNLKVHMTNEPRPVAAAWDDQGKNVTALVSRRDGKYVDGFGHTKYMGVAKKHFIEINLGSHFPGSGKGTRWLLAYGWMKPTNSSINLALSQGSVKKPQGIRLKVPDGKGGWTTAKSNVGFPAGKNKMVMIRLDDIFRHPGDHRIRLTTSTSTYLDQIRWARELPDSLIKRAILKPRKMKLRFRGYSKLNRADSSSPSVPHYNDIRGTTQRWRSPTGFYTRYGDVTELLQKTDDRYVIMSSGDEMRFRFKESSSLKNKGWNRDFIFMGDGWEKDDDVNTLHSQTVLPLPSHKNDGYKIYKRSSVLLKDDPVYKTHKIDWVKYHTRYLTPQMFNQAMHVDDKH